MKISILRTVNLAVITTLLCVGCIDNGGLDKKSPNNSDEVDRFLGVAYTLTTNMNPYYGGSILCSPNKTDYTFDEKVTLTVTAANDCEFKNWSGDTTSTSVTITIRMNDDKTLMANFEWMGTTFTDSRDNKTYKTVKIGNQTWIGENLNYDVPSVTTDVCYENNADNCAKYGRLYNWSTAMNGAGSSYRSPSGVQGVCPSGWHLPSSAEWRMLENFVGGSSIAGEKLKSIGGWRISEFYDNNGTDDYGFSALPGGGRYVGNRFVYAGVKGIWWSASEDGTYDAWGWAITEGMGDYDKTFRFSVRCVADP